MSDERSAAAPGAAALGTLTAAVAFLLPLAFSPAVEALFFSPKAALLPAVAAAGGVLLWTRQAPALRAAAWCARAFLVVATVATLISARPGLALLGLYNWGTGLVFVAALVGAWAIGAHVDDRGAERVASAFLLAMGVNAAIAIAQMRFDLSAFGFTRVQGRAHGLLGNPIHLAALLVPALVLAVPRLAGALEREDARPRIAVVGWSGYAVLLATALSLSGGRTGLVLSAVVALWAWRRFRAVVAACLVVALAVGWVLAPALDRPPRPAPSAAGVFEPAPATDRAAESSSPSRHSGLAATVDPEARSLRPRIATWWSSIAAIRERPLLGAGPGQFRAATIRHRPLSVERDSPGQYFVDAHNIVVEYSVTTGLIGLAALVAWAVTAARIAGGSMLVAAAVMGATQMVQPLHVAVTPLAFLFLGIAARQPAPRPPRAMAPAALVGLVAGAVLLVGDFDLRQGRLDFRRTPARQADALLRPWPEPAVLLGRIALFHGTFARHPSVPRRGTPEATAADREAHRWLLIAAQRDPTNVELWTQLGDFQHSHGMPRAAEATYRKALNLNPWSARVMGGLGSVRLSLGDETGALAWFRRAKAVDPSLSDPAARVRMLRRA